MESKLALQPQPLPDPATLLPTDVILSVRSAAVGWVDLLMTSGQYQHLVVPPYCPGMEYTGVIEWLGSQVDRKKFKLGDRVLPDPFYVGPRAEGAYQQYGGFASYAVAPSRHLFEVPEVFSFDEGCNFLGNYETAYHCLLARGRLQAGETILILGSSGATGLAAVHLAKRVGAKVIAVGRSEKKLALVQKQGADHTIIISNPRATGMSDLRDQVKALTQGRGVDVVYDGVGGELSIEGLRCLRFGGRFLIVGWAATPDVSDPKGRRGAPRANQLPTHLILMKGLDVLGCPTAISTKNDPSIRKRRLRDLWKWVREGKLRPVVSHAYALKDYRKALLDKWESQGVGGIVLRPAP